MSALVLEPVSPELVLVAPAEVAALARERLPDSPAVEAPAAAERGRRVGVVAFWAFCVVNCLAPFVLAAVAAS